MKTPDGTDFYNPLTKKTEEMNADVRAGLQAQLDNVTNQGRRIMRRWGGQASGGVIGANEFGDQAQNAGNAQPQQSGGKPAAQPQASAPAYLQTATDAKGNKIGFNAKTRQWEPIKTR
jgi:hypothetical protein